MSKEAEKEVSPLLFRYLVPDEYSQEEKEAIPIPAEEIITAIKDGKAIEIINAVIEGPLILKSISIEKAIAIQRTKIKGPVDCSYAAFKQILDLTGSIFEAEAIFTGVTAEKDIFLNSAIFSGDANFSDLTVSGVFYGQSTKFKKGGIFNGAIFKKRILFDYSSFEEGLADFGSAQIGGNADFTDAVFKQKAFFCAGEHKRDTFFKGTIFLRDVNFRNSSFRTIFFDTGKTQFSGKIDLRGSTYDRIEPVSFWQVLLDKERLYPYDRQPFTQMEETFRQAGEDSLASAVYYERKIREAGRIKIIKQPLNWIGNRFLWLLTGYGVKLWRLFLAFTLILLLGPFIFHLDGAVKPKQEKEPTQQIESQHTHDGGHSISWAEAYWVNLHLFLPVEIPSGSNLEPTTNYIFGVETRWGKIGIKYMTFATMLKLAGWVLVPIALAGLSGLLKR
jgi:hypothetical protein